MFSIKLHLTFTSFTVKINGKMQQASDSSLNISHLKRKPTHFLPSYLEEIFPIEQTSM